MSDTMHEAFDELEARIIDNDKRGDKHNDIINTDTPLAAVISTCL